MKLQITPQTNTSLDQLNSKIAQLSQESNDESFKNLLNKFSQKIQHYKNNAGKIKDIEKAKNQGAKTVNGSIDRNTRKIARLTSTKEKKTQKQPISNNQ